MTAYLTRRPDDQGPREWPDPREAPGGDAVRLRAVRVRTAERRVSDTIDIRESVQIEIEYEVLKEGFIVIPHFSVHNSDGLEYSPEWTAIRPGGADGGTPGST